LKGDKLSPVHVVPRYGVSSSKELKGYTRHEFLQPVTDCFILKGIESLSLVVRI